MCSVRYVGVRITPRSHSIFVTRDLRCARSRLRESHDTPHDYSYRTRSANEICLTDITARTNSKDHVALFHFTDSRNLVSIRQYGLLSWKRLVARKIVHWPSSSEDSRRLDARSNLQDYVRLCTGKDHPMAARALHERRIQDYVWLEISDEIIRWRANLFCNDNAVANRTIINGEPNTALQSDSVQAEVLILGGLNAKWIAFPAANDTSNQTTTRLYHEESGFDLPF